MRFYLVVFLAILFGCKKTDAPDPANENFSYLGYKLENQQANQARYVNVTPKPTIRIDFSHAISSDNLKDYVVLKSANESYPLTFSLVDGNKSLEITPTERLDFLNKYDFQVSPSLKSVAGNPLLTTIKFEFYTQVNPGDIFPRISNDELLTLVQKQTFKYFWDFGHPVSGMARERNTSGDLVTTGGTGFGVMAILVAIERGFISRSEGYERVLKISKFLDTKAEKYHGAFSHWLNGETGKTIPFSEKDNGADLVETSLLMQGLLTAREYFSGTSEKELNTVITKLWEGVEWSWFGREGNVLYWHWSPNYGWDMDLPIRGWNECLITYVLAASSPTYPISKEVYQQGFARAGDMRNGNSYYGVSLPLGEEMGGPLFLSQYSFLGLNPNGLMDQYGNYEQQAYSHAKINQLYCKANPKGFIGYSEECWGLTASDNQSGYSAHSPTNDLGVITPTAALSSIAFTPDESIAALHFFYYKLGDKLWGEYGFRDAFNLNELWFAGSYLAIDQGPIICMIENYRSKLLWSNFMKVAEVKAGLNSLGFTHP